MRIGELAERAGTSTRALRYYEQHGLIRARRATNGYREYDETDLRLVREIRSLLDVGFNLEDTRPFVECLRSGRASGAECPASIEALARRLADLDTCIARLHAVRVVVHRELRQATDERQPTDEPEATDEPHATDERQPTDEPEATDEPHATDERQPTDEAQAIDEREPTDERQRTDEAQAVDEGRPADDPQAPDEAQATDDRQAAYAGHTADAGPENGESCPRT